MYREEERKVMVMAVPTAYTVEEVAEILKVHTRTVYRMLERKELRGFKVGSAWRISDDDLQAFMRGEQASR